MMRKDTKTGLRTECRVKNRRVHQPQIAAGGSYRDTGPGGSRHNDMVVEGEVNWGLRQGWRAGRWSVSQRDVWRAGDMLG